MSNVYKLSEREDCTTAACEWLARIDRGLSVQEESELQQWLDSNPSHRPALLESAAMWDGMGSLARLADLFPKPAPRRARFATRGLIVAAASLAGVAVLLLVLLNPFSQRVPQEVVAARGYHQLFETAVGEHSTIRLPDGSELTLNTNSRVLADFDEGARSLRLERGEVFVKVAHDEARPLTVWARDRLVRAVGTAFNVEITEREHVEVIVTEGKVLIGVVKADAPSSNVAWLESVTTPVVAGQRALLDGPAQAVEAIDAQDIEVKLSWREGNIVFHDEPLAQALGEIARYTRVEFIIRDEELKTVRVAGLFRAGDVDGLLQTLRENFNISYERIGADKIVLKGE
jgi:transmembrane sensor